MIAKIILQAHDLTIGYTPSRKPPVIVARDLAPVLRAGELVCLIGPNGAGKSTLLRTLAGMQPPLAGTIRLMGDEMSQLAAGDLARRLSIVLTERPHMGLMSGYEMVALGRHPYTDWSGRLSEQDEQVIWQAVEAVGAGEIARKPVEELSDGQRQRLMIARALAQEPAVMLLDEPTAFLDLPRRVETLRLLKQLTRTADRAILLSTHDLDLALRTADCIWLMASDGILHTGAPEDLVLNGAFETVFQAEGIEFDRQSGAFKVQAAHARPIRLTGEGIAYHWTQRALEREGYHVAPEAPLKIDITASGWYLHSPEGGYPIATIYELMQQLNQHSSLQN